MPAPLTAKGRQHQHDTAGVLCWRAGGVLTEADIEALLLDIEAQVMEEIQAELAELERQEQEQMQHEVSMAEQHMQQQAAQGKVSEAALILVQAFMLEGCTDLTYGSTAAVLDCRTGHRS
jgi:hypothetical protein